MFCQFLHFIIYYLNHHQELFQQTLSLGLTFSQWRRSSYYCKALARMVKRQNLTFEYKFTNLPVTMLYLYSRLELGQKRKQAENGLQLRSSENGKTAVWWHYGMKLQWYLNGDMVWFCMVWYGFVGIVWYWGWGGGAID